MKRIRQWLFYSSMLLLPLFLLTNEGLLGAAEMHVSCSQDGFDINGTLSNRAKILGTDITMETADFQGRKDPLDSGLALVFEAGQRIYYLWDSTRPGIPLPAHDPEFFRIGDLLVVGGCEGNGGTCAGWLFLVKIGKGALKLLDVWENGFLGDLTYDLTLEPGSWKAAGDGALFRINLPDLRCSFYVKATHEGFTPVFDPSVYGPFCESTDKLPVRDLRTLRQSCVCTFFLEKDKKKAREESKSKIDRYYGTLIRKARTFPDRRMNYEQYHEYLSPRLSEGWEYQAIADAFEGPANELAGPADLMRMLNYKRRYDIEDTMKIFANFSRIRQAFRPEGNVSLTTCDGKGGPK